MIAIYKIALFSVPAIFQNFSVLYPHAHKRNSQRNNRQDKIINYGLEYPVKNVPGEIFIIFRGLFAVYIGARKIIVFSSK